MARMRMITLFDLAAKHRGIPLGTGNKTERLFGYFTWHADDSPPINPLGDLFKTQVLGAGAASRRSRRDRRQAADGGSRRRPDRRRRLRDQLRQGRRDPELAAPRLHAPRSSWRAGSTPTEVALVQQARREHALEAPAADRRDDQPDGDRRESYLRPVDY